MHRHVYAFGGGSSDGNATMKKTLGGKGANLAEMARIGLPVPPGFTITTEVCDHYYRNERTYPEGLWSEVDSALAALEEKTGKAFGDPAKPLLVSVRSGAAISMPGMMDTVLNLGLNKKVAAGLAKATGNERFVWDLFRRLVNMFGDVVMGVEHRHFEAELDEAKAAAKVRADTDLDAAALKRLTERYLAVYRDRTGEEFPSDPRVQLRKAIDAVFGSWETPRAVEYRRIYKISGLLGTAVNVQAMVYGNMGETSGTGVAFTRDPSTGENVFYGEFLMNAQGEDVVAGIRTPRPIAELETVMPECYRQLTEVRQTLERHYKDIQDLEFTIEGGRLFLLQTRSGKRTAFAAVKIAVDMVEEGTIDRSTALRRVEPDQLNQLLHPGFDPKVKRNPVAKGLAASPGAAVGKAVFTAADAVAWAARGEACVLVRAETSPEDIAGMNVAKGILTSRGGMTSHAAVVARGMGKPCVAGCGRLLIDEHAKTVGLEDGGVVFREGDYISIDGSTGEVMPGRIATIPPRLGGAVEKLLGWADETRRLGIRANADTPLDARRAREFGAQGIGLCRTEHMFFGEDRIPAVREMILASDEAGRRRALKDLLPMQRSDFEGIFEAMDGFPVTIRLLDPPLHEFLPMEPENQREMAERMGLPVEAVQKKVESLRELNPMLGHRGCRLGISFPEIYEMQVQAIAEAALAAAKKGVKVHPEIMHPLVGTKEEIRMMREMTDRIMHEVFAGSDRKVHYLVGTMIEVPRAALVADRIAEHAEFFSFGTNDLTQMTFGYSRDDAGSFLPGYLAKKVLPEDPFVSLDAEGVGQLVDLACKRGRSTRAKLKLGICGEHGGDPASIRFCHEVGLDYVSCSPFRVPIARLAAAHAALGTRADSGTA